MLALAGEVNPGTDRDFARIFTVASTVNAFGDYINETSLRLFQYWIMSVEFPSLAKLLETSYLGRATVAVRRSATVKTRLVLVAAWLIQPSFLMISPCRGARA